MIRIVVALPAESRPLIHHFGLERNNEHESLSIFQRPDLSLIVSGVGRESAASAVSDLDEAMPSDSVCAWLNIGVAGHRFHGVGTAVIANSVVDDTNQAKIVLDPPDLNCEVGEVRTVDRVEVDFAGDSLYEMEAAGFCVAAEEKSSREVIQVLKIVSDNLETGSRDVSARQVQTLVESCLPLIDRLVYAENRRARQLATGSLKRIPSSR